MSNTNKYIITALVTISVICVVNILFSYVSSQPKIEKYEQDNIIYEDRLSAEDLNNDSFKVQYQVKGIANIGQKSNILNTVKKAVQKVERIIAKSNKFNYITSDPQIPVTTNDDKKLIKDLYLIVTISDENIKEDSGLDSEDTVGGSNILETKTSNNNNIFPVVGTIQLLKSSVLEDVQTSYDVDKYPYTEGLNRFYYVFLHEMLHVLGVGFLWTDPDYQEELPIESYNRFWIKDTKTNPVYVGPSLPKYNNLSATVYYYSVFIGRPGELRAMPIENDGLEGTKFWHWEQGSYKEGNSVISKDERVIDGIQAPGLENEIMVGWGIDKPPILSTITIANLEDLGYIVNYNEAEVTKLSIMKGDRPISAPIEKPYMPDSVDLTRQRVAREMEKASEGEELYITDEGSVILGTDSKQVDLTPATKRSSNNSDPTAETESDYTIPITMYSIFLFSLCSSCFMMILLIILGFT